MSIIIDLHALQILEGVSYLSAVGLFVVAIVGLKQLTLSKEIANTNSQRDALKLANNQIEKYLEKIVSLSNLLDVKIEEHNITFFDTSSFSIGQDNSIAIHRTGTEKYHFELILNEEIDLLNALESFSSFFNSNIADEKAAFQAVGRVYVNTVSKILPSFHPLTKHCYYKNVIELFLKWHARIREEDKIWWQPPKDKRH